MNLMEIGNEAKASVSNPMGLVTKIGGAVAVGGSLLKSFTIIHEGEVGLRVGFGTPRYRHGKKKGQIRPTVEPGMCFVAPFTHSVRKINIRDRNDNLPLLTMRTSDAGQINVESSICWNVRGDDDNPYKALFQVENGETLTDSVVKVCARGLRRVVRNRTLEAIENDENIQADLETETQSGLSRYGVQLNAWYLESVYETPPQLYASVINPTMYNGPAKLKSRAGGIAVPAMTGQIRSDDDIHRRFGPVTLALDQQ